MYFANLHLHSTYSDAGFTPTQLVYIGKALGYSALALTDHETDGGCTEFMHAAEREGIKAITGAEFYAKLGEQKMHLTALDFDRECPEIRAFIEERCATQAQWVKECVELGLERGFIAGITWDDILDVAGEGAWICTDTLFETLRRKRAIPEQGLGYVRVNVMKDPHMRAKKPYYPEAADVIKAVRAAGGVIALAHPSEKLIGRVEELVALGLNGIETCHPDVAPEVASLAFEAAGKYNLYHCGGTDHTGPMSCCGGKYAVPAFQSISEENFQILVERRLG